MDRGVFPGFSLVKKLGRTLITSYLSIFRKQNLTKTAHYENDQSYYAK